ncbi:MAG: RIP metalloprotease RseP [Terracidiphilus sp.]|jgi:regulator of sigma E protease
MHEFLISAVAFIILVGLMVVVHEFGHFVVAKLCRVRVEAFAFGFGPRLFGYTYGDTDYKVCLLPLGGYVKMAGENFAELSDAAAGTATVAPVSDPGAVTSHPRWQQMLISAAGPVANFVLAFVLMVGYFGWINEVPAVHPIVVEWVTDGSPAAQAGIKPGDIISNFAAINDPSWTQIEIRAIQDVNQTVPVTVERAGKSLPLSMRLIGDGKKKRFDVSQTGLFLQLVQTPIQVDSVTANAPAAQAGLQGGDLILAVDGHAFHTLDPMVAYLQSGRGKPVTLTVSRNGHTIAPLVAHPVFQEDSSWRLGFTYILPTDIPVHQEPLSLSQSVAESKDFCVDNSTLILDVLGRLLTHKVSVSQLSGPVGIARVAGDAAETKGWFYKFWLAAAISINLGILNLLPFPILDGGSILFLLIESLLRRSISINVKERIYQAAFVLLITLFVVITFNDIAKLPFFTHLKP